MYQLAGVIWNDDGTMATTTKPSPLEALKYIENFENKRFFNVKYDNGEQAHYEYRTVKELFSKEFEIIEAALRNREVILKNYDNIYQVMERHKIKTVSELDEQLCYAEEIKYEDAFKLKVLDIIKERKINVEYLVDMFEDWNTITYEEWVIYYEENGYYIQGEEDFKNNRLLPEEFDLLKGEFVCEL